MRLNVSPRICHNPAESHGHFHPNGVGPGCFGLLGVTLKMGPDPADSRSEDPGRQATSPPKPVAWHREANLVWTPMSAAHDARRGSLCERALPNHWQASWEDCRFVSDARVAAAAIARRATNGRSAGHRSVRLKSAFQRLNGQRFTHGNQEDGYRKKIAGINQTQRNREAQ